MPHARTTWGPSLTYFDWFRVRRCSIAMCTHHMPVLLPHMWYRSRYLPSKKGYRWYSMYYMCNMTDVHHTLAGHSQLRLRSHAFVDLLPHGCRPGIVCCLCSTDISKTTCELRPMNSLVRSPTLSVALNHIPVSRAYIISGSIMESTHLQEKTDSKERDKCIV